ncbi:MAG: hypothetical protein ACKN9E_14655 [Microcystaceae cyanobacterium]
MGFFFRAIAPSPLLSLFLSHQPPTTRQNPPPRSPFILYQTRSPSSLYLKLR